MRLFLIIVLGLASLIAPRSEQAQSQRKPAQNGAVKPTTDIKPPTYLAGLLLSWNFALNMHVRSNPNIPSVFSIAITALLALPLSSSPRSFMSKGVFGRARREGANARIYFA